jgi:ATP-dependent exoDNAse (exonuclease V) beta subunit
MTVTIITASAGSGKTHRLTEELSRRLSATAQTPLRANQIIATTFTVRAAADLVEKTQQRLLDDGNIEAAEEIRTALIGTVNSVAGRIVTDYAIDAGFSPQVRVLDEEEQQRVFRTAADHVIAQAEATHRDLLLRTGHNGEAGGGPAWGGPTAWADLVNDVVTAARTNHLDAEDLRTSAEASVREFLRLVPETGSDDRARWRDLLAEDVEVLRHALRMLDGDAGTDSPGERIESRAQTVSINGRSRGNVEGSILTLDAFVRKLGGASGTAEDLAAVPWDDWARIARGEFPAAGGGKAPGTVPKAVLADSSGASVARGLLANPAFQDDVVGLIRLVFDTAAQTLDAYRDFKEQLGVMDFVDQEVRALDLLRSDARVRDSVAARYRLLAVDEFQDTSPLQLALFMELAQLVDDVIWVGDRKQAIYSFRGADPQLMDDVFDAMLAGTDTLAPAQTDTLGFSWRSSLPPLELSNTVFRSVFADQPEDQVVLSIPPQRQHLRDEGSRELWVADSAKGGGPQAGSRLATTIAQGIVDLLEREPQVPATGGAHRAVVPGDIAVLVRSNSEVARVVSELRDRGVPATGAAVPLLETREGQLVRAGLAAVVDSADTVSLAELVTLLPDHAAHTSWFDDAVRIVDAQERREHSRTWWEDETLRALADLRGRVSDLAPTQLLLEVIDALDLPQRIKGWTAPEARLATLDGLRQLAVEYEERARSTRTPMSAMGMLAHIVDEAGTSTGAQPHDEVMVLTLHGSKGLQWPVVVTGIPQAKDRRHRAVAVQKAQDFRVEEPLAGRTISFLPHVLASFPAMQEAWLGSRVVAAGTEVEKRETARLLYVGLTRARFHGIIAASSPDGQGNALNDAVAGDVPVVEWDEPTEDGPGIVRVHDLRRSEDGSAFTDLPITMRTYATAGDTNAWDREVSRSFFARTDVPMRRLQDTGERVPARFTASSADSDGIDAEIRVVATLGEPLIARGGVGWDVVGDAVHAYLAIPHQAMPESIAREAAERIIDRWGVGDVVQPDVLCEAGARWARWVEETYPGSQILTEQPIAWRNERHQLMDGWIDARILLSDGGHVLVDHKSYPGTDPLGHVRKNYVGQLAVYAAALEATMGEAPKEILVHLPLRGEVVGVTLATEVVR